MEGEQGFRRNNAARTRGSCRSAQPHACAGDRAYGSARTTSGDGADGRAQCGRADRVAGGVTALARAAGVKDIRRQRVGIAAKIQCGQLQRDARAALQLTRLLHVHYAAGDLAPRGIASTLPT